MANTDSYFALPSTGNGLSISSPPLPSYTRLGWNIIDVSTMFDISIYGIIFSPTVAGLTGDANLDYVIEIATGNPEVIKIQIPYVLRNDTAVGFFYTNQILLSEPVFIPQFSRLSVRLGSSRVSVSETINGFKILYQGTKNISVPTSTLNNYQRLRGGIGPGVCHSPMFEMLAEAVKNEAALEKVAVLRSVLEVDDVAAVRAARTTEPDPLVDTSPACVVSEAAGAPPVPSAA